MSALPVRRARSLSVGTVTTTWMLWSLRLKPVRDWAPRRDLVAVLLDADRIGAVAGDLDVDSVVSVATTFTVPLPISTYRPMGRWVSKWYSLMSVSPGCVRPAGPAWAPDPLRWA